MTINWQFIAIIAIVIASLVELIKKIPVFSKTWKYDNLRCFVIWIIAFAITIFVTFFAGIGFGITTGWASAISYSVIAFFLQKFVGEEFMHKILSKATGVTVESTTDAAA